MCIMYLHNVHLFDICCWLYNLSQKHWTRVHTGFGSFRNWKKKIQVLEGFGIFLFEVSFGKVLNFFVGCRPPPTLNRTTVSILLYYKYCISQGTIFAANNCNFLCKKFSPTLLSTESENVSINFCNINRNCFGNSGCLRGCGKVLKICTVASVWILWKNDITVTIKEACQDRNITVVFPHSIRSNTGWLIALLYDDVTIKISLKILLFNARNHGRLVGTKQIHQKSF